MAISSQGENRLIENVGVSSFSEVIVKSTLCRPLGLSELPPETAQQLPACVIEMHDNNFWVCASCKKAYWQGSQYTRSKQYLIEKLRNPQSAAQLK